MILKRLTTSIAIFSFLFFLTISLNSQKNEQDAMLAEAWDTYQKAPTSENALKLYQSLPGDPATAQNVYLSQREILQSIYEHFEVLERQVLAKDRNSVKVAFKLLAVSDGDFGETICIVLGRLIKINPRMFLQELKAHIKLVNRLDGLLGNLGEQNIDEFDVQIAELQTRINALQEIKDGDLLSIRDECISVLNKICEYFS